MRHSYATSSIVMVLFLSCSQKEPPVGAPSEKEVAEARSRAVAAGQAKLDTADNEKRIAELQLARYAGMSDAQREEELRRLCRKGPSCEPAASALIESAAEDGRKKLATLRASLETAMVAAGRALQLCERIREAFGARGRCDPQSDHKEVVVSLDPPGDMSRFVTGYLVCGGAEGPRSSRVAELERIYAKGVVIKAERVGCVGIFSAEDGNGRDVAVSAEVTDRAKALLTNLTTETIGATSSDTVALPNEAEEADQLLSEINSGAAAVSITALDLLDRWTSKDPRTTRRLKKDLVFDGTGKSKLLRVTGTTIIVLSAPASTSIVIGAVDRDPLVYGLICEHFIGPTEDLRRGTPVTVIGRLNSEPGGTRRSAAMNFCSRVH